MRVALVNKYWYLKGGSERVVFDTKEILESHGHEVACFGMEHPKNLFNNEFFVPHIEYSELRGIEKLQAGVASIYNRKTKKAFGKFLDAYSPEVIHIHNIYHQLSFSILDEAMKRHIPIVATMHDYKLISPNYRLFHHGKIDLSMLGGKYYRCMLTNCGENFFQSVVLMLEAYMRKWKKYADHITTYIAPSNWVREIAIKAGLPAERVVHIDYPMDMKVPESDSRDGEYVLFFGRFSKEKGLDVLLRAAQKTPHIPYHLVGEGEELEHLKKMVTQYALTNVTFFPFQTGQELQKTISGARLTVMPSIWHETLGLSALRSIAYKKVVIASNLGGLPDVVPSSMLVPPGDPEALAEKIGEWYETPLKQRGIVLESIKKELTKLHDPALYYKKLYACYEDAINHEM